MGRYSLNRNKDRIFFWVAAILLLFFRLGDSGPWQSEDRWLEVGREMLASGKFFKPTINLTSYFDKPLLSYWLELLAAQLSGGLGTLAMRLPSAISALIALWSTIALGEKLWSKDSGVIAGWILLTSFGFLQWGRLGEADMENLAATIVAVCWYWRQRDRQHFGNYLTFYLIIAIGAQCKGLTAAAVPLIVILPDLLKDKRWKEHLHITHAFAAMIAASVYALPFNIATAVNGNLDNIAIEQHGWDLVIRENIVRYFAPFDHTGSISTYFIAIPQFLFPWSFVFITALIAARSKKFRDTQNTGWVLWALGLIFLFFTLSGSRRNYYILPILPYCALISARFLQEQSDKALHKWACYLSIASLATIATLQLITPLLWPHIEQSLGQQLPLDLKIITFAVGIACIFSLSVIFDRYRNRPHLLTLTIISCALILWSAFFFRQQFAIDDFRTEMPFALSLKPLTEQHPTINAAIYREKASGRLLFYSELPLPVQLLNTSEQLQQFIDTPPYPKLVLAYKKYSNELPTALRNRQPELSETQFSWENNNGDKMLAWLISAHPNN
ncbi:MAG: hypothetical protein JWM78_3706 [Verrucomicrobiaceae bacterium]|nr:hypothetical protein [Verrucomicrobiaceae bacterium]